MSRAEAVLCREQKKRDLKKCQVKKIKLGWLCWCWESALVVVLVVALLYIGLLVKSERKKSSSRILFGSVKYL